MRNFDLLMDSEMLSRCTVYRISRSSSAYSYFLCEFRCIDQAEDGSLIAPPTVKMEEAPGRIHRAARYLRDRVNRRDHSVRIPVGSNEQLYFKSEFRGSFPEDMDHNTIVPEDEYPRSRSR